MARNRNILGQKSIDVLQLITADTMRPFTSSIMVDRMAAMLNYALRQLVGPRSRALKVQNADKYNFNPLQLARGIIFTYLNLGTEESFCAALPRDGRSFSPELFPHAERVLR